MKHDDKVVVVLLALLGVLMEGFAFLVNPRFYIKKCKMAVAYTRTNGGSVIQNIVMVPWIPQVSRHVW